MFITFEGTEGAGKSTQIQLLCEYLAKKKRPVAVTLEPGGTELGLRIRQILLSSSYPILPTTETLLYMASRAQLVDEVVAPALKAGKIVICDRWVDATIAYQGYGSGVDLKLIRALARMVTRGIRPDLTLFLDLDVRTGLKRVVSRGEPDRIEKRALSFHEKVRRGYLELARRFPKRIRRIPVTTVEETQARIREAVNRVL